LTKFVEDITDTVLMFLSFTWVYIQEAQLTLTTRSTLRRPWRE